MTEQNDVLSGITGVLGSGQANIAEGNDTLSATAGVAAITKTGDLAITEANDSLSATVVVKVGAGLAVTEGNDLAGFPDRTASLSITEDNDVNRRGGMEEGDSVAATSGGSVAIGTLTVTEEVDSVSGAAVVGVKAALSRIEGNDTLASSVSQAFSNPVGLLSITEESDTVTGPQADQDETLLSVVSIGVVVDSQNAESDDSLAGAAILGAIALVELNVTEADDTLASTVLVNYSATLVQGEATDAVSADGSIAGPPDTFNADLDLTEGDDTCFAESITGNVVFVGGGISRRRRKRWILPDGQEIYADEEEVRKLLDDLRAGRLKPQQVIQRLQKPLDPFLEVWDEEPPKVEVNRKSTDDEDFLALLELF